MSDQGIPEADQKPKRAPIASRWVVRGLLALMVIGIAVAALL